MHEQALRVLLHTVSELANRYKRVIHPLLCLSIDFYIRIFIRVYDAAEDTKDAGLCNGYVLQCPRCPTYKTLPAVIKTSKGRSPAHIEMTPCDGCSGMSMQIGGPVYLGPIHDKRFIESVLNNIDELPADTSITTAKRMKGMLSAALEELDVPLYFTRELLAQPLHIIAPSLIEYSSALIKLGYEVSGTHANPLGFKTNAPWSVIWDVMRKWAEIHPPNQKWHDVLYPKPSVTDGESEDKNKNVQLGAGAAILAAQSKLKLDDTIFDRVSGAEPVSRAKGLTRYQQNPTKYWGPKKRARAQ